MSGYDQEKRYAVVAEVRRKWTEAEKQAILAEAETASVSAVSRKHGVAANLVFRWRQQQRQAGAGRKSVSNPAPPFVPVALPAPSAASAPGKSVDRGMIEIELASGHRLRVEASIDPDALKRIIAVLALR
jgi:transposase